MSGSGSVVYALLDTLHDGGSNPGPMFFFALFVTCPDEKTGFPFPSDCVLGRCDCLLGGCAADPVALICNQSCPAVVNLI